MEFKGTKDLKITETNGNRICIGTDIDLWCMDSSSEQMNANAKLFIAAPELLEALQNLYNDLESWKYIHADTKKLIEQAINKALN